MPPKKSSGKGAPPKVDVPLNGLVEEGCPLPGWDDAEVANENFGGDFSGNNNNNTSSNNNNTAVVDHGALFVDQEFSLSLENVFGNYIHGWKRPSAVFSPFKPMVYRPQLPPQLGNPYMYDANNNNNNSSNSNGEASSPLGLPSNNNNNNNNNTVSNNSIAVPEDDDAPKTQAEIVALYRRMRSIIVPITATKRPGSNHNGDISSAHDTTTTSAGRRRLRRRGYESQTPYFMRAFNSALMVLSQNQCCVPPGKYAWELIYPQLPGTPFPVYNVYGKYIVKLFFRGGYRKVIVDDRLPVDANGDSVISVTDQKEIWPALLFKAMLKALGPGKEHLLIEDPCFIVQTLLGGYLPERVLPGLSQMNELRAAEFLRLRMQEPTRWIVIGEVNPQQAEENGLDGSGPQLYNILEAREYQNTLLVRMCGMNAHWSGRYGYDNPTWTVEVEDTIEFVSHRQRNQHDLAKGWIDFWIAWEDLVQVFQYIYLMHPVLQEPSSYGYYKQISAPPEIPVTTMGNTSSGNSKPPRESPRKETPHGASAAASAAAAAAAAAAAGNLTLNTADGTYSCTKWIRVDYRPPQVAGAGSSTTNYNYNTTNAFNHSNTSSHDDDGNNNDNLEVMSNPSDQVVNNLHNFAFRPGPNTPVTQMIVSLLGIPKSHTKNMSLCIEKYTWHHSCPFGKVLELRDVPWHHYSTFPLAVTAGSSLYRLRLSGLQPNCTVSMLGPVEFTLGEEKEILREANIFSVTDAGKFAAHEGGSDTATIWFKRWFTVDASVKANFVLQVLPHGTDITPFKMNLIDNTIGGKPGKGGSAPTGKDGKGGNNATGKKGDALSKTQQQQQLQQQQKDSENNRNSVTGVGGENAGEQMDPAEFAKIIDYVTLTLINLDNGTKSTDTLGKLLQQTLNPSKAGYILFGYATPPTPFPAGLWKLRITSDHPLASIETRSNDEQYTRTNKYSHNSHSMLFKYNFTVPELATAALQVSVRGTPQDVAFPVRVYHNDKSIEVRQASQHCIVEQLTLTPGDKANPSLYSVTCVLERDYTDAQEKARHEALMSQWGEDCTAQESKVEEITGELLNGCDEEGKLPPEAGGANPASGTPSPVPPPSKGGSSSKNNNNDNINNAFVVLGSDGTPLPPGTVASSFYPPIPSTLLESAASLPIATIEGHCDFGITYVLTLHASSSRVDLKEDTTFNDDLNTIKASWCKREGIVDSSQQQQQQPTPTPAKTTKPPKGQPVVDEAQVRATRAKEARLRYLANPTGRFIPFIREGISYKAPQHGGHCPAQFPPATLSMMLNGGTTTSRDKEKDGSQQQQQQQQQALQQQQLLQDPPTNVFLSIEAPGAFLATPVAPCSAVEELQEQRSCLFADSPEYEAAMGNILPTAAAPGSSVHKAALAQMLEAVSERCMAVKEQRKTMFAQLNASLQQKYEIKPPTAEVEEDKKGKRKR